MAQLISDSAWNRYKSIIRDAHDTFNQEVLTWVKFNATIPEYWDDGLDLVKTTINIKCLAGFNYFRTWPITRRYIEGELDNENMVFYLNQEYLSENNWLTSNGYFNFDADRDLFIHRGLLYKCEGDTFAAQAFDIPLFILLVLKRQPTNTGYDRLIRDINNV